MASPKGTGDSRMLDGGGREGAKVLFRDMREMGEAK